MIQGRSALTIATWLALFVTGLPAQGPSVPGVASDSVPHYQRCFRGRPRPACDAFWLTEIGLNWRIAGNRPETRGFWLWELGYMVNRGPRTAIGVAGFAQYGGAAGELGGYALGIRPRLRYWMNRTVSIDIAPGVVLRSENGASGFAGHIGLDLADRASVAAQLLVLRPVGGYGYENTPTGVFLGGRLGSTPGAILGSGMLVLLVVAAASGSL